MAAPKTDVDLRKVLLRAVTERWVDSAKIVEQIHRRHPQIAASAIRAEIWDAIGAGQIRIDWSAKVKRA